MLTIEKGIPIPSTKERKGENVELLRSMKPGDSVFFDAPIVKKATRFYRVAKKLNVNVIIRREGLGMRLWLVGEKEKDGMTKNVKAEKVHAAVSAAKKGNAEHQKRRKASSTGELPSERAMRLATETMKKEKKRPNAKGDVTMKAVNDAKKKTKAERDRKRRAEKKTQAKKVETAEKALASFGEAPNA